MPLEQSSSKEALKENIAREVSAGKDPKQAAAIEYSVQRKNDDCDCPICQCRMALETIIDRLEAQ